METVDKPWGREIWWAVTDKYVGKILEVKRGHSLSLQYHREKLESMYFSKGEAELTVGDETRKVGEGFSVTIPPGTLHRITAITDVTIFEISTPHLQDVVRVQDEYGRASE